MELPQPQSDAVTTPAWQRWTLPQIALGTAIIALIVLAAILLITLRYVVILLFLGIVLATALNPLFERLRTWGAGRTLASVVTFAILFAVVGGILAALVPFILAQVSTVLADLPGQYTALRTTLTQAPSRLLRDLALFLPLDPFANGVNPDTSIEQMIVEFLPGFVRGLAFSVLVLLLAFYWLYYRAMAIQSVALLIPMNVRGEVVTIWERIEAKIGAFVRGLAVLMVSIGILSFIGYTVIGLPYALTIALIAALLEAVPYVGALISLAVAVLVGLSISPEKAILALVVANVVQLLEGSIVVPRAMDRTVGVNPVVTLLALAVFAELFGLLGALLAVPLAAAVQVLLDHYVLSAPAPEQLEIGGRDQLALLRYKTQDLASDLRQQLRGKDIESTAEADAHEEELEAVLADLDSVLAAAQGQAS